jgi:hypothetical protein
MHPIKLDKGAAMAKVEEFEGMSLTSFEEAAMNAISQVPTTGSPNVPHRFTVVEFAVSIGGFVSPQYLARVRRA